MNMRPLHLQHHVLEGVELQEAVDGAVIAETHGVPVRALHGLGHDRATANLAPHPAQDRVGENRSGGKGERPSAPGEEAVLCKEVGKVLP